MELTPRNRPGLKLVLGGGLSVAVMLALAFTGPRPDLPPAQMASVAPLSLAQSLIEREPGILILDLRTDPEEEKGIPGALPADEIAAVDLLRNTPGKTTVVVYDETGAITEAPSTWPRTLEYRFVEGGLSGWKLEVLTPVEASGATLAEREWVVRQNQISAFFSGAAVQATSVAAPPPAMSAGPAPKKKAGGC